MSCSCKKTPCRCGPACDPENEPLSSALNNFIISFFGSITKTCVDDKVVWMLPCNLDAGIPGFPRLPNEGLACYFLRVMELMPQGPAGPAGADGAAGATGPEGPPGPSGPGDCCCFIPDNTIIVNQVCYTTFQSAYDAAIATPGGGPVAMYVGKTDLTFSFGDLTLTADYDSRVRLIGMGKNNSRLGSIIGTNSGNGYNVNFSMLHIAMGDINTSTSDVTGTFNGGNIIITSEGILTMGNLTTTALTGNIGGYIQLLNHEYRALAVDTRGQKGGGNVEVGINLNISYGTYGCQFNSIDTRAMSSGAAGNVIIGDGVCVADSIDVRAMVAGTGGKLEIRRSAYIRALITRGTVSPGLMQFDGCYIFGQMDNVGAGCKFKDVTFFTDSLNRTNILEVISNGALFTGCFFISNGTGVPIAASVPRTIVSHFTISQKALDPDVTVSSGTFTVEPALDFTRN